MKYEVPTSHRFDENVDIVANIVEAENYNVLN